MDACPPNSGPCGPRTPRRLRCPPKGWPPFALALCACAGGEDASGNGDFEIRTAALSITGCETPARTGLPDEVERLEVRVIDADEKVIFETALTREANDLGAGAVLLERIPVGEDARLIVYGCTDEGLGWVGRSGPLTVRENRKASTSIVLRPPEALSCTGTGLGPDFDRHATLHRPRAFAAVTTLADGRVVLAGGASRFEVTGVAAGGNLQTFPADADVDVFDPGTTLFSPSLHRGWTAPGDRLLHPRIGGRAATLAGDSTALALVGGDTTVSWSTSTYGPLVPNGSALIDGPTGFFVERWDTDAEAGAEVRSTVELGLVPRFMPATAYDERLDTLVIAGGLERGAAGPSARLDLLTGGTLRTFPLDQPRIGASLTPLGDGRFLLWGGNVSDCGERPALLIDSREAMPLRPLPVEADVQPPRCPAASVDRPWWVTGWHSATRVRLDADGTAVILVVGGLEVRDGKFEQTPNIGGDTGTPNVFLVTLPSTGDRVLVEPVPVPAPLALLMKRALHPAVLLDDRVFVGGGWGGRIGSLNGLYALDSMVALRLEPGTAGVIGWEAGPAMQFEAGRIGHAMVATREGTLLVAGGVRDVEGGGEILDTAEVFVPRPRTDPCAAGRPPSFDLGTPGPFDLGLVDGGSGPADAADAAHDASAQGP
ncbi:hypothetical protein L6V77_00260 [Myxococcota bacterium]|nr:hypothetical protein [Myxococcota bacterium]